MDRLPLLITVLGLLCLLVLYMPVVNAECCVDAKVVKYKVLNGPCAAVKGQRSDDGNCISKICGDGWPLRGTYCGRGPCDVFGCKCEGGCLSGDWENSLVNNAGTYKVKILEISWENLSFFRMPSRSVWDLGVSIFEGKK